jgi:hypothetical protein
VVLEANNKFTGIDGKIRKNKTSQNLDGWSPDHRQQ